MRILIAEDEVELAGALKFLLEKNRFSGDVVHDGEEALERSRGAAYDVIVLDIMMPGADGMEVLAGIRGSGSAVPVLMLTARGGIEDRVAGLEAGADDYLPKPFAGREFVARVKALSRRNAGCPEALLSFGDVSLDRNRYMLGCGEQWVRLNNKEFQLAELFLRHPRFVFSTSHLMDRIWGQDSESGIDVVWTHIGFVRRKLKQIGSRVEIRTIRGAGYSMEETGC